MKRKAEYLTTLEMRRAVGNDPAPGEWDLIAPLRFYSAELDEIIEAPAGFRTNLASVPRLPLAYWLFGGQADEPSVTHDFAYTNNIQGMTRKQADALFLEACKAMGISAWRRGPMWLGIRVFGGRFWGTSSPLATPKDAKP